MKKIIIDANFENETRVALLDKKGNLESLNIQYANRDQIQGKIYLAKVTRIEPSLQAAFVDYGNEKSGFLPFSEIHSGYFNIPVHDKVDASPAIAELDGEVQEPEAEKSSIIKNADDVDLKTIEKMVDEQLESDFNLDAEDLEVEKEDGQSERPNVHGKYKIQEVIKKGQVILVQAIKDERGNKGAAFTSFITLAGRYCVLMPNAETSNGVSKKISNQNERKRLKRILNEIVGKDKSYNSSLIIRTAGAGHSAQEINRDYNYLVKLWNKIRTATLEAKAPSFIHQEDGVILKTIRNLFDRNVKEILVQGVNGFNRAVKFAKDMLPEQQKVVKEYRGKTPIFTKYAIEEQISNLYQPSVKLPSGGYIVINPTEALISIDINSGKATSERTIEETALKINLEAAKEIARQIILRDLSGLIVIDFIDMSDARHRKIVERSIREYMRLDKARIQTNNISYFGLLEISRQRLKPSFLELNTDMCPHCSGKGIVRANDSNAMLVLRTIENEIHNHKFDVVNIYGIASSILYLLNNKRQEIAFIEAKHNVRLNFNIDPEATSDSFSLEKIKLSAKEKRDRQGIIIQPALQDLSDMYASKDDEDDSEPKTISVGGKRKINRKTQEPSKRKRSAKPKVSKEPEAESNNKLEDTETTSKSKPVEKEESTKQQADAKAPTPPAQDTTKPTSKEPAKDKAPDATPKAKEEPAAKRRKISRKK